MFNITEFMASNFGGRGREIFTVPNKEAHEWDLRAKVTGWGETTLILEGSTAHVPLLLLNEIAQNADCPGAYWDLRGTQRKVVSARGIPTNFEFSSCPLGQDRLYEIFVGLRRYRDVEGRNLAVIDALDVIGSLPRVGSTNAVTRAMRALADQGGSVIAVYRTTKAKAKAEIEAGCALFDRVFHAAVEPMGVRKLVRLQGVSKGLEQVEATYSYENLSCPIERCASMRIEPIQ